MVVFGDENKRRRNAAELLVLSKEVTSSCSESKNESLNRTRKPSGKIPIITQSDFNSLMTTGTFHENKTLRAVVEAVSNAPKKKGTTGKRSTPITKDRDKPEIAKKTQTRKAAVTVREARPPPQNRGKKTVVAAKSAPKKASPAKKGVPAPKQRAGVARGTPQKAKAAPVKKPLVNELRAAEKRTPTRESAKEVSEEVLAAEEDTIEVDDPLPKANKIDMRTFYLGGTCETEEEANERERIKQQRYRHELEAQLAERHASGKRRMSYSSTQALTADGSDGGAAISSDSPCSMTSFGAHSNDEQKEEKEKQGPQARLRAILDQQIAEQTDLRLRLEAEKRAREEADEERVQRELVEIAARETQLYKALQPSIEPQQISQPHSAAASPYEPVAAPLPLQHQSDPPPTTRPADSIAHPRTARSENIASTALASHAPQQSTGQLGVVYAPAYLVTQTPHGATIRPISQSLAVPALRPIPQLNLPARPYVTRSLDRVNTQIQYFAGNLTSLCGQFGQKPGPLERSLRGTTRLVESPSPNAKRSYVVPRSGRADSPVADSLSSTVLINNNNKEMQSFLRENIGKASGRWGGAQPDTAGEISSSEGSDDATKMDTTRGGLITERSMANISKFISTDSMMDTWKSDEPSSSRQSSPSNTPRLETPPELEEPPIKEEATAVEAVEDESDESLVLENSPVQADESIEELDDTDESRQSSHCSFIDGPSISLEDSLIYLTGDDLWSSCHYTAFIATVLQTEELKCRHELAETLSVLRDRAVIVEQISSSSEDDCTSRSYTSESSFLQELSDDTGLPGIFDDEEESDEDTSAGPFLKLSGSPDESGSIGGSPLVTERHPATSFAEEAAGTGGWSESSGTLEQ